MYLETETLDFISLQHRFCMIYSNFDQTIWSHMKLAFIEAENLVFVTTEEKQEELVRELRKFGYTIDNISLVPLGSSIQTGVTIKTYGEKIVEIDTE